MKKELLNATESINEKATKYELRTLSERLDTIANSINDYRLKVLFVGGFSAGKSALINTMMDRDLLEENQRPETAIAGEIVYDTQEYIEAVSEKSRDRYDFSEKDAIDKDKYSYLIWHVNCPEIGALGDCTIVDMPGFNSGISDHNKAILNYAEQGNAYVLVIDCEEGTIKNSVANFIKEIKNYNSNMSIVVSKSDLKPQEEVKQICDSIAESAQMVFYDTVDVISASKFTPEDTKENLIALIRDFDSDNICYQEFQPKIYDSAMKCIDDLEIYKNSISFDTEQIDEDIQRHEDATRQLAKSLDREKNKLESNFKNSVAPSIMADVSNALYSQKDALVSAMKSGGNAFSQCVNNILRPVLLTSTKQYVEQSFEKFVANIDISTPDIEGNLSDAADTMNNLRDATGRLMETMKTDEFNSIYKVVLTTLSVATSVVAPWLELVLIFLPEIFKIFNRGTENRQIQNKVDEVIPQIVQKLKPEVENSLLQIKDEMLEEVENQFAEKMQNEVDMLEKIKAEKLQRTAEYENNLSEVTDDIAFLREIIETL